MSGTEYFLNAVAWSLFGMIVLLVVQRTHKWWLSRDGRKPRQMSTNAYFGLLLVLIAVFSTLITFGQKISQDRFQECQNKINKSNVNISNERARRQDIVNNALGAENANLLLGVDPRKVIQDTNNALKAARQFNQDNPLRPLSDCKRGQSSPPRVKTTPPRPTPSRSN